MRSLKGQRGELNLVSLTIYLLLAASAYISWKYAPVWWQRENLIDLCQNAMISTKRLGTTGIANAIVELADKNLGLKLKYENIRVALDGNRAEVEIVYTVTVRHLFGMVTTHTIHVYETRDVLD